MIKRKKITILLAVDDVVVVNFCHDSLWPKGYSVAGLVGRG